VLVNQWTGTLARQHAELAARHFVVIEETTRRSRWYTWTAAWRACHPQTHAPLPRPAWGHFQ
jgi:hypothetical protein